MGNAVNNPTATFMEKKRYFKSRAETTPFAAKMH
jgi:hypothetical protein